MSSRSSRVAVIGAGVSGVCTAAHLLKYGLSVIVLERCDVAGGVWHFDKQSAHDNSYSRVQPSQGDYTKYTSGKQIYITPPRTPDFESGVSGNPTIESISKHEQSIRISHAPPGPCYSSLKNNVPLTLMKTSLLPWPSGLEEFVSQEHLERYIQRISKECGVDKVTEFNTRVEDVKKVGRVWTVTTAVLHDQFAGLPQVKLQTREFDAVVVATGHYHMPRIPEIPGLLEWKEKHQARVRHSKTYRSATGLDKQRILLIGSGVSSCDIAKDLALKNAEVYQSSRGGVLDLPSSFLPESAVRIGAVESFVLESNNEQQKLDSREDVIPGYVTLRNGSKLCGIHHVMLATGYITSYPFLQQFHSDTLPGHLADDHLLVTREGDMVHNLHKDIFYIEDPTLAFVGVPYHIATFSLFDFQAQAVARVLGGLLQLPSKSAMRSEYEAKVKAKGLGRDFHSLRDIGEETAYVAELVAWANHGRLNAGDQMMIGHSDEFLEAYYKQKEKVRFLLGSRRDDADAGRYDHVRLPGTAVCS